MLVVYSKANCPQCEALKMKFKNAQVEFVEIRVDQQPDQREWLMKQGHRSVPVVYQDGYYVAKPERLVQQ